MVFSSTSCQIHINLFCRDPLENYFGRQGLFGARKGRKDNPSSKDLDRTCKKHNI